MNPADEATGTLVHYFQEAGVDVGNDGYAEIQTVVESIVDEAVRQAMQQFRAEWGAPDQGEPAPGENA